MKQSGYKRHLIAALLLLFLGISLAVPERLQAAAQPVTVTSCKLTSKGKKVTIKVRVKEKTSDMGKKFYLFALDANASETKVSGVKPLASVRTKTGTLTFRVKYKSTMLCQKFALASKSGDTYRILGTPRYITNPELLASYTGSGPKVASKKGLQVEDFAESLDLGIKHAVVNWTLSSFLTSDKSSGLPYKYRGKTYYLNPQTIAACDSQIQAYSQAKIKATVILLLPNDSSPATAAMRYKCPSKTLYSMIKTSSQNGCRMFEALMTFLASRYGTKQNLVSGWILGNEVNSPDTWNYGGGKQLNTYMNNYARAFRICYNTVKSVSKKSKVYISLDYNWNYDADRSGSRFFTTKSVLDKFYSRINEQGKIVFNIAYHAYPQGLRDPVFWDDSHATSSTSTNFITFNNLNVLTNYVKKNFGKQYTIMLSEQSFNSTRGEEIQAAAYAYAYYKSEADSMIESFIYGRQFDHAVEMADGLHWGLSDNQHKRRLIWDVFQYIDSADSFKFTDPLLKYTNLTKWTKISGFKKSICKDMPSLRVKTQTEGIYCNSTTSATLLWKRIASCDGYEIYRDDRLISSNTGNSELGFTDKGLTPGQTYTYRVRMYKNAPASWNPLEKIKLFGALSDPLRITVTGAKAEWKTEDCTVSGKKISLSWKNQEGVSGYEILRAGSENGLYTPLGTTSKTTYTDSDTVTGTTYYYKVRAYVTTGTGRSTAAESDPLARQAQIQLDASIVDNEVALKWTPWPGAVEYRVYATSESDNTFKHIKTTAETAYSCVQYKNADGEKAGFDMNEYYWFRVRAKLADGTFTEYSNTAELQIVEEIGGKQGRRRQTSTGETEDTETTEEDSSGTESSDTQSTEDDTSQTESPETESSGTESSEDESSGTESSEPGSSDTQSTEETPSGTESSESGASEDASTEDENSGPDTENTESSGTENDDGANDGSGTENDSSGTEDSENDGESPDSGSTEDSEIPDSSSTEGSEIPDSGSTEDSEIPDSGSTEGSEIPDSGSTEGSEIPDSGTQGGFPGSGSDSGNISDGSKNTETTVPDVSGQAGKTGMESSSPGNADPEFSLNSTGSTET